MNKHIELTDEWTDLYAVSELLSGTGRNVSYHKLWHHCKNNHIKMERVGKRVSVRTSDLATMPIVVDLGFLVGLVNARGEQ